MTGSDTLRNKITQLREAEAAWEELADAINREPERITCMDMICDLHYYEKLVCRLEATVRDMLQSTEA